jgi:amino acid adenylation domain-containing protein
MRVEDFLSNSARRFPDKLAIADGAQRATYQQMEAQANRFGHVLRSTGVQRGDRVVVFCDNSLEAVVAIFGTLRAGAVFSPVNPTTKADKLAYVLNNCRAEAIVTQTKLLDIVREALKQASSVKTCVIADGPAPADLNGAISMPEAMATAPSTRPADPGIDIDLAMLIYTSGSTGFPKGVMMTHQNVVHAATSISTYLRNVPEDIVLNVMPISFDYGLYQVLMTFRVGMTLILEKSFAFPQVILKKLADEKVTGFPIVPTIAAILLQLQSLKPGMFPHLRYVTNTAAALPPAHILRLQELFPSTLIFSMYGLTECKRCTYLEPEELQRKLGSVGKAIPNSEAWVMNDQGQRCKPDEVGELVIRGGHVMKGYWENPEATDRMLKPGRHPWEKVLYTGDLFRADEEGYLYFVGRKDDIIKTRGEKVSPKEVESVLYMIPGIKEAAVIGVPDPILGMAIKAVIVPADGQQLDAQQIIRHCAGYLEDFMVPKSVEFRSELPKTSSGKIRRSEVQAEALRVAPN